MNITTLQLRLLCVCVLGGFKWRVEFLQQLYIYSMLVSKLHDCIINCNSTICIASGYMASVTTPRLWVTNSTISFKPALFTSFHFKSLRGSWTKSKRTQHCLSFWMNSSSLSAGVASKKKINKKELEFSFHRLPFSLTFHFPHASLMLIFFSFLFFIFDLFCLCSSSWTIIDLVLISLNSLLNTIYIYYYTLRSKN